jgi:hypothetical protein
MCLVSHIEGLTVDEDFWLKVNYNHSDDSIDITFAGSIVDEQKFKSAFDSCWILSKISCKKNYNFIEKNMKFD